MDTSKIKAIVKKEALLTLIYAWCAGVCLDELSDRTWGLVMLNLFFVCFILNMSGIVSHFLKMRLAADIIRLRYETDDILNRLKGDDSD